MIYSKLPRNKVVRAAEKAAEHYRTRERLAAEQHARDMKVWSKKNADAPNVLFMGPAPMHNLFVSNEHRSRAEECEAMSSHAKKSTGDIYADTDAWRLFGEFYE